MSGKKRKYTIFDPSIAMMAGPQNKRMHLLLKVMASLMGVDYRDVIKDKYLTELGVSPIFSAKAKYKTQLIGAKWLAPLFYADEKPITVDKGKWLLIRDNGATLDIEMGTDVYRVTKQNWNEKSGYFSVINNKRVKGGLDHTVNSLLQTRRYDRERQ